MSESPSSPSREQVVYSAARPGLAIEPDGDWEDEADDDMDFEPAEESSLATDDDQTFGSDLDEIEYHGM